MDLYNNCQTSGMKTAFFSAAHAHFQNIGSVRLRLADDDQPFDALEIVLKDKGTKVPHVWNGIPVQCVKL